MSDQLQITNEAREHSTGNVNRIVPSCPRIGARAGTNNGRTDTADCNTV